MLKKIPGKYYIFLLWIIVAAFCWVYPYFIHRGNNYKIFIGVYEHLRKSIDLYAVYPHEYYDTNHYGPVFSLLIAPFAVMPYFLGGLFWNIFNSAVLLFAIYKLPLDDEKKNAISLLSLISFAQSQYDMQSNALIAAMIILSLVFTLERKEAAAAFLIILGTLIKLYPIVGLSFLLFSPNKIKFAVWVIIWGCALPFLPALISSFDFVLSSYTAWINSLEEKNQLNLLSTSQNYSIIGLCMRIFREHSTHTSLFLIFGMMILGMNLLAFRQSGSGMEKEDSGCIRYKLYFLSSVMLTVVLFSTGSESQTYIIAVMGCFIWLVNQEDPNRNFNRFLIFLLIFISIVPTDLFPKKIRDLLLTDWVMMTWPCIIIWLKISWELNIRSLMLYLKQDQIC